jgi:hypothetical protein
MSLRAAALAAAWQSHLLQGAIATPRPPLGQAVPLAPPGAPRKDKCERQPRASSRFASWRGSRGKDVIASCRSCGGVAISSSASCDCHPSAALGAGCAPRSARGSSQEQVRAASSRFAALRIPEGIARERCHCELPLLRRRGNLIFCKMRLPPLGRPRGRLCPSLRSGLLARTSASGNLALRRASHPGEGIPEGTAAAVRRWGR